MKTTDGGKNWVEKQVNVKPGYYEALAIFFLDENTGILGGLRYLDNGKIEGESYFTKNAGQSWNIKSEYVNLNKVKLVNNNIFASGKSLYKISIP